MSSFNEVLSIAKIGFAEVRTRDQYEAQCKTAVASVRGWTNKNWLFIRYLMRVPTLDGGHKFALNTSALGSPKQPVALAVAFYTQAGTLAVGGAALDPRDRWNRHAGQWQAIRDAIVIPGAHLVQIFATRKMFPHKILGPENKDPRTVGSLVSPWTTFIPFPPRSRTAALSVMESAVFCRKKHGLAGEPVPVQPS